MKEERLSDHLGHVVREVTVEWRCMLYASVSHLGPGVVGVVFNPDKFGLWPEGLRFRRYRFLGRYEAEMFKAIYSKDNCCKIIFRIALIRSIPSRTIQFMNCVEWSGRVEGLEPF